MAFNNNSGLTINDGDLTNANNVYNNCTVMNTKEKQEEKTIWDDYNHVIPGNIRIEGNTTTSSVRLEYRRDEEGRKQYRLWRDVDARRNVGIARLQGEGREEKFLCVTYDGPDAFKAFKQDFHQFAHIRHANVAQIFGYNNNERGLPALVFHDALIPLERIVIKGHRFLPLLYSYFSYQFGRMQRELAVDNLLVGELWVEPRTGALQKGPYVELPLFQSSIMYGTSENTMANTHSTYLSIQTYSNDDTVFEYLTGTSTARTILTGIRLTSSLFFENLASEQAIPILSSLPGAIYNRRSRDIIAGLPGARERLHYGLWRVNGRIPDGMRESQVVMNDGSVRFTVMSTEMQGLQGIELLYMVQPWEERTFLIESWLTQAHSVFSKLGIHEDNWEDYGILHSFNLCLERTSPHQEPNIPLNVYLFIQPVPRPSDDEGIWRSWMEGEKYFWSFDPFGREMVPELVRAHLGLPYFAPMVKARHIRWYPSHYDAVQKLHTFKGFDHTTMGFALSLGLPVLEVIGDKSRFEDLEDSCFDTLSQAGDDFEPRSGFSARAFSAKKPKPAVRTLQSTRSSPRLQQLRARKPDMKSPGKPKVLGKRANRKDVQAVLSKQGETTTAQRSRSHRKALGTSRPSINFKESSSKTLSEATTEDVPEAQAGPSTETSTATTRQYYLRRRETNSFVVSTDANAVSPETGLQPPKSRKQKRVDDLDSVPRKKSRWIEHSQNNERKRRQPSELDSDRPKKRRRGL